MKFWRGYAGFMFSQSYAYQGMSSSAQTEEESWHLPRNIFQGKIKQFISVDSHFLKYVPTMNLPNRF